MRARHFLFLIIVAAGTAMDAAPSTDCGRRVAAEASGPRTVVLAGDDSWVLMNDYLTEIKKRKVSPWKVRVMAQVRGKAETYELSWGKMLTGENPDKVWERTLAGKSAEMSPKLLAQARSNQWDVICVGQVDGLEQIDKNGATSTQPPPPPPPSSDVLIFYKSGVQYAARGDYASALKEFAEAEKRKSDFPGLLMNIGVTHMRLKDYVRASDYLTRAIKQNPRDGNAQFNMACLQARLGQRTDAVASLAAAKANGVRMTAGVRNDPDLSTLRGRKDFEDLFR